MDKKKERNREKEAKNERHAGGRKRSRRIEIRGRREGLLTECGFKEKWPCVQCQVARTLDRFLDPLPSRYNGVCYTRMHVSSRERNQKGR